LVTNSFVAKNHQSNEKSNNNNWKKKVIYLKCSIVNGLIYNVDFVTKILWSFIFLLLFIEFQLPNNQKKLKFWSFKWTFNHQMIKCFFFKMSLTNFLSSNQWQGWSSPLIGRPKFFWSLRKSKTKKTTKNFGCLNFLIFNRLNISHFWSLFHYHRFFFPIKLFLSTPLTRFWFNLALSWPKLTLFWCNIKLCQCSKSCVMLWWT